MNQYQTALEKIEDPEDAIACKKAELEEKNYDIEEIDEFLKITEQGKEEEEEGGYFIDFEKLPRVYKYGYDFIRRMNEDVPVKIDESIAEDDNNEENNELEGQEELENDNNNDIDCEVLIDDVPNNENNEEEKEEPEQGKSFVRQFF